MRGSGSTPSIPSSWIASATASAWPGRRMTGLMPTSSRIRCGRIYRFLEPVDPVVIQLREWSRMTEDLSEERNRLANKFRHQLWRYYPQFLDVAHDWARSWVLDLWDLVPTPAKARKVRPATMAKF